MIIRLNDIVPATCSFRHGSKLQKHNKTPMFIKVLWIRPNFGQSIFCQHFSMVLSCPIHTQPPPICQHTCIFPAWFSNGPEFKCRKLCGYKYSRISCKINILLVILRTLQVFIILFTAHRRQALCFSSLLSFPYCSQSFH